METSQNSLIEDNDSLSSCEVITAQKANVWNEETKPDVMNGSGTYMIKSGNKYEGEFFNGKKRGMVN